MKGIKYAGKWYNLAVQVAAEQAIEYTADCVIDGEPLPPCRWRFSFGVAV